MEKLSVSDKEVLLHKASKDLILFGKLFLPNDFLHKSSSPPFHYDLGKKLIARAYMLSRGKDEVEAQRFAEKAARTGFRPVKTPMPDEQQLRQLAQSTQELENRYA